MLPVGFWKSGRFNRSRSRRSSRFARHGARRQVLAHRGGVSGPARRVMLASSTPDVGGRHRAAQCRNPADGRSRAREKSAISPCVATPSAMVSISSVRAMFTIASAILRCCGSRVGARYVGAIDLDATARQSGVFRPGRPGPCRNRPVRPSSPIRATRRRLVVIMSSSGAATTSSRIFERDPVGRQVVAVEAPFDAFRQGAGRAAWRRRC